MSVPTLEVCVEGIENARAAAEGGADRIELCAELAVGGVTPSAGAVAHAARLGIPVQVLIRPRGGDFRPTRLEWAVMRDDIRAARRRGAAGIVLGLLHRDGRLDAERTGRLVDAARPLSVTFHKAFDSCVDPFEALEHLISLGVERVLTSGGAATAHRGLPRLIELRKAAGGRIGILVGGGIRHPEISAFRAAGLTEIHVGSAAVAGGKIDPERVRRLLEAVHAPTPGSP